MEQQAGGDTPRDNHDHSAHSSHYVSASEQRVKGSIKESIGVTKPSQPAPSRRPESRPNRRHGAPGGGGLAAWDRAAPRGLAGAIFVFSAGTFESRGRSRGSTGGRSRGFLPSQPGCGPKMAAEAAQYGRRPSAARPTTEPDQRIHGAPRKRPARGGGHKDAVLNRHANE
ncbi:hypothetical protein ACER0C_028237 [Sarotherodon galilaeus]